MSALSTLKKFLKNAYTSRYYYHPHPDAALEWFLERYWGKKEAKIIFDKGYIVISAECIEYIPGKNKYRIDENYKDHAVMQCIECYLMFYSANYCKYCRDKRREFWEMHREIIERLPLDAGKFVMNLPMFVNDNYDCNIILSNTKFVFMVSEWCYINNEQMSANKVLEEFKKEYNAAKRLKFSAKCWRFADVSVHLRCRA